LQQHLLAHGRGQGQGRWRERRPIGHEGGLAQEQRRAAEGRGLAAQHDFAAHPGFGIEAEHDLARRPAASLGALHQLKVVTLAAPALYPALHVDHVTPALRGLAQRRHLAGQHHRAARLAGDDGGRGRLGRHAQRHQRAGHGGGLRVERAGVHAGRLQVAHEPGAGGLGVGLGQHALPHGRGEPAPRRSGGAATGAREVAQHHAQRRQLMALAPGHPGGAGCAGGGRAHVVAGVDRGLGHHVQADGADQLLHGGRVGGQALGVVVGAGSSASRSGQRQQQRGPTS